MGNKIQGEGDYESARRFNKAEQDFVKRKFRKREALDELDSDDPNSDDPNLDAADAHSEAEANADDDTIIANNIESQDAARSRTAHSIPRR